MKGIVAKTDFVFKDSLYDSPMVVNSWKNDKRFLLELEILPINAKIEGIAEVKIATEKESEIIKHHKKLVKLLREGSQ